jgi:hypothetical protein
VVTWFPSTGVLPQISHRFAIAELALSPPDEKSQNRQYIEFREARKRRLAQAAPGIGSSRAM